MSQNLATNPIRQMPQVAGPHLLHMKIIDKLVANGLDQTAYTFAKPQLLWTKLTGPAVLGRYGKLKSLKLKKFRFEWFRKIRPVSQQQPGVTSGQFPNHVNVMHVGGGKVKRLNHADGIDLHMKLKTIKGLIAKLFAIAGYTLKEFRAFGSGKSTNRHREAVQYDHGIPESFGYVFEQPLFDRPQFCRLTSERNPAAELWEIMSVKSFEEFKDGFVGVQAEEFADNFDGKYFAVG